MSLNIFYGVKLLEKWFIRNKKGDYKKIAREHNITEFLSKLLVNRDIKDKNSIELFLNPNLNKMYNPLEMKDLYKAAKIIKEKIIQKKKMRIVGDFDVDGVMSIYILYTEIKKLGGIVDYTIPDRVNDGYGINKDIVYKAKEDHIDTIITCDNGIAAIEQVKLAKELGLNVIVTDHHDIPFEIDENTNKKQYIKVDADAVVNPKQIECKYPFKYLCGAAVAFKLIQGLYIALEKEVDSTYSLLEYVAMATVSDVMDLVDENRIIVKNGLNSLNNTKNIGLKALMRETGIENKEISVYHIGFILGPNINASGRLDSALKSLELLLAPDEETAAKFAKELFNYNEERKLLTLNGFEKIANTIDNTNIKEDKVLVIYEPEINESVAGIIAGRIKERYNKPSIVLTMGKDGVKGSGRSIEEYNMFDELTKCKDLLSRFGGHPMAAGLSLEERHIPILRKRLNENTALTEDDLIPKVYIDMELPLRYLSFKLINELKVLEPFGKGNNKPLFGGKGYKINRGFLLGKDKNVLKLILQDKDTTIDGLFFGDIQSFESKVIENYGRDELDNVYKGLNNNITMDALYYPSINEYNGFTNIQIVIQSYRFR